MMSVEKAAGLLDNLVGMIDDDPSSEYDEAIETAIRSLKTWHNVHEVLQKWAFQMEIDKNSEAMDAYWNCVELIEQKLKQEVSDEHDNGTD